MNQRYYGPGPGLLGCFSLKCLAARRALSFQALGWPPHYRHGRRLKFLGGELGPEPHKGEKWTKRGQPGARRGRVLQEIADPAGALALGRQGSSARASSSGDCPAYGSSLK